MHDSTRKGIAVGFFDGVHRGHQAILSGAAGALTFREHPLRVVEPDNAPRLIMPLSTRLATLESLGVEVTAMPFTPLLAKMEAEVFARSVLWPLAARYVAPGERARVRCGANWRFGRGAKGSAATLEKLGFAVDVVPFASFGPERISSSRIRAAIEAGDLESASQMLSRPWTIAGLAVPGKKLGAKLGFPTLNIAPQGVELDLPRGVYAVRLEGLKAIANWGIAPTMGDKSWSFNMLEVHVLDPFPYSPAHAEEKLWRVEMLHRIRDERRFDSLDALKKQIARDIKEVQDGND